MSLIMDLIRSELPELYALELKKFTIFDFVYTLASANIDQSVPNLVTIYIFIRSQRVPRGSVVKCLTRNPGVLGLSRTRSSGFFFVGQSLGKTLQSPA